MLYHPITDINGVGPKKAAILKEEAGIENIEDLLYYIPRAYTDRSSFKKIADCLVDENVSVSGEIKRLNVAAWPRKRLEVEIDDGSDTLTGIFFAGISYFMKTFNIGEEIIFAGKITFYKQKQMIHPEHDFPGDALNTARIVPLYRSTERLKKAGFDSKGFRKIVKSALSATENIYDAINGIAAKYALPGLKDALNWIHFPETFEHAENARRRLAFNEIFFLLFYISLSKAYIRQNPSEASAKYSDDLCGKFIESLPFTLTDGQKNAIDEIKADMSAPFPMNRLLQGDVGSGKTVVALAAAMLPISADRQAAFMAPTEVLAKQHFETIKKLLPPDIKNVLLTGSSSSAERNKALNGLADGSIKLITGTHALIQNDIRFKDLAYIIIDEQHRFGVKQRAMLREKGEKTDLLIMSATPIPRSLSMTVFGDLDISSIKNLPSCRKPVKTLAFHKSKIDGVYKSMEKYIKQGRQIFYVLPLIDDSEKIDLESATAVYTKLAENIFSHRRVALIHGRLKQNEKDQVMSGFAGGNIDILISTTVIEVGIDIPNASIIVIEHPERFGLSQLHQLRGRVGRGEYESFCVLVYDDNISAESRKRIEVMLSTNDGFVIAEEDLKIRGSGEITGTRQHGYSEFEFADLIGDIDIITAARDEAAAEVKKIVNIGEALENCLKGSPNSLVDGIRKKRAVEILS